MAELSKLPNIEKQLIRGRFSSTYECPSNDNLDYTTYNTILISHCRLFCLSVGNIFAK